MCSKKCIQLKQQALTSKQVLNRELFVGKKKKNKAKHQVRVGGVKSGSNKWGWSFKKIKENARIAQCSEMHWFGKLILLIIAWDLTAVEGLFLKKKAKKII
ncbi:hypothetical protein CDAR_524121, partial [Caerostris darwini]